MRDQKHQYFYRSIPKASTLEKSFLKNHRISMAILLTIVLLDFLLLFVMISTGNEVYYFFAGVAIVFSLFSLRDDYVVFFKREKVKLENIKESKIGNYETAEIKNLIASIFDHFKGKEIPKIYIIDDPIGGAHVIDTYLFNFIGPVNAIYLPRQEFHYLKPHELKAIVAHEIGHFYYYMYPAQRFPYPFYLFVSLLPALLIPILNPWMVILIFITLQSVFYRLLHRLFNHKSKSLEYLSDLFAAKLCGKLNVINALMISSKYTELVEVLQRRILKLIDGDDELSMERYDEIFEKLIRILPDKPNSTDEVDKILSDSIKGVSLRQFKTKMTRKKISKEKAIISDLLNSPDFAQKRDLLDWDTFDFIERNHRVEEEEYQALIENIKDGHLYLVDSMNDEESTELNDTHPALRQRILFLDKNVPEMNASIVNENADSQ